MNVRNRIGACILGALLAPLATFAQISTFDTTQVTLRMTPEYPSAGDTVQLSISSYALDLNRSTITWKANGKVFATGEGVAEASVSAGAVGSVTDITVDVESETGQLGFAEARIAPSDIQILWTADSYVPPFFKGRKSAGSGAKIDAYALVAFTNGTRTIAEKDIIYTWYRGNMQLAALSGRGKSRASLTGPVFGSETFRVVAESVDRSRYAEGTFTITAHEPELELYENHPLFGVLYHRAFVGEVNTAEQELRVTAVPYFARTKTPNTLSYEWAVNTTRIPAHPDTPETLVIDADGFSGAANLSLTAMNPNDILMRSLGDWRITFGATSGFFSSGKSIFGE